MVAVGAENEMKQRPSLLLVFEKRDAISPFLFII
jgi:hypothetical protein